MQPSKIEKYPHNSAGRRMVTNVPIAKTGETAGSVIRRLSKESGNLETIDYIYVLDKSGKLAGVVSIRQLLSAGKKIKVHELMNGKPVTVSPSMDQEKVSDLALKHNIKDVPVVEKGKLVGVVPNHKIMSILNRSLQEDILHFAGIHKSHLEFENTMAVPFVKSIEQRFPWLIVGLFGILLTAVFINTFEQMLEKYLILAFFIPTLVYMSDAIGTQLQTLYVRDLAVLENGIKTAAYFSRQMLISLVISLLSSVVVFGIVAVVWKQPFIGLVIGLSMITSFMFSAFTALLIVYAINRLGSDPALGSGPLATVISDALTIVIYFAVAVALLG